MRLMIVEDHAATRESLKLLLSGEPAIDVMGACPSAEEALEALSQAPPDVLLVDIELPGMSGVDLTRRVKQSHPGVEIMIYTIFEDRDTVFNALKAGATGYLLKGSSPRELIEALSSLYQGGAPMSPQIARKVILEFQAAKPSETNVLSSREILILRAIKDGQSYKNIAESLSISRHTVHSHIKHIYEKLHAQSRAEAFIKAQRLGAL